MSLRVLVLTLLVAVSSGIAYWLTIDERKTANTVAEKEWLGGLSREASAVNAITVENHQGIIFQARQESGKWVATHLDSLLYFPVEHAALAEMVNSLAQAKVLETKTANAQNYRRLGVESIDQTDAQSTRITLANSRQQWQILVGNVASNGLGNFVRQPEQKTSYLINQQVALPATPTQWLTKNVLPFKPDALSEVVIQNGDSPALTLHRTDDDQEWMLAEAGQDERLAYPGVLAQTVAELTDIRYDGVTPYLQNEWEAEQLISDVTYTLQDGTQVFGYIAPADDSGHYKAWFATPDSPQWISDWVLLLSEFQVAPFLTTREQLIKKG